MFLDEISDNIDSLLQIDHYGAIDKTNTKTLIYYGIKYVSEVFILQIDTTIGGQVIKYGEISVLEA